jgi:hypothetical protein
MLLLITPAIAHTTNEGSYKYGYSDGFYGYDSCSIGGTDNCDFPDNNAAIKDCYIEARDLSIHETVTNSTACFDGYVDGRKHWCQSDLKDCGQFTLGGMFPGYLISGKNYINKPNSSIYPSGP